MADDVLISTRVSGETASATIAADEISSKLYQRVKPAFGADGSATDVSSANPLPVDSVHGVVSAENSTSTPLDGSATFTGSSVDLLNAASVSISVATDRDGDLYVDFSPNGTNWDYIRYFFIGATLNTSVVLRPESRYMRVRYTNSGVAQSSFRLQTVIRGVAAVPTHAVSVDGGGASQNISAVPVFPVGVAIGYASPSGSEAGLVTRNLPSGTQAISAASLPLPSGAAQEHATAGSPHSARLSDGSTFISSTNPLPVTESGNVVSTANSTTTPLSVGQTFTGTAEDVSRFASVVIHGYAVTVTSGDSFLSAEFSQNGSDWSDWTQQQTLYSETDAFIQVPVIARYCRVKVTSPTDSQTVLRVQTILCKSVAADALHVSSISGQRHRVGHGEGTVPLPASLYDYATKAVIASATSAPGASERGIVTRNIPSGTQAVSAASLPLPSGAATEATLGSVKTAVELIDDAVYTDGTGTPSKAIGIAGTDGTNPQIIKTDTNGELQVDVLSSALPTGAATAAKQPALGTAGSPSSDVITVQGAASMTALKVDGSAVTQPVSGTFWQATQPVSGTVTVQDGGGVLSVDDNGSSLTVDGTVAATQSGTWTVNNNDGSGNALASSTADPDASDRGLIVRPLQPKSSRYTASSAAFAAAASATDIATITGSASKTVRVLRAWLAGTQTTAGTINAFLIRRSTANTGGTSTDMTEVLLDTNNAAVTATVLNYTANPTLGTTVGNVRSNKLFVPAPATAAGQPIWMVDFTDAMGSQGLVLRGTSQVLAFNLGGVTVTGNSFVAGFEWIEES